MDELKQDIRVISRGFDLAAGRAAHIALHQVQGHPGELHDLPGSYSALTVAVRPRAQLLLAKDKISVLLQSFLLADHDHEFVCWVSVM